MRTAFIEALVEAAAADPRVWLVCGDLGYSVLERFRERFPDRFLNAGVAEQNMTGVAAGLAHSGKKVFVYSIVNFPVMRCLEQVRNDVCYHGLDVKVVAVGGGLVYGGHGYTHHGAEDLAVMRLLPHMTVVAPGDPVETRLAVGQIAALGGPCYLRLGRNDDPPPYAPARELIPGRPNRLRGGRGLTIAATGGGLRIAMEAAEQLDAAVFSVPFLSPLDVAPILESAEQSSALLSVEDHGRGGLGTILAEAIAERPRSFRFRSLHLAQPPVTVAGSEQYLRGLHGLDVPGIVRAAVELTGGGP